MRRILPILILLIGAGGLAALVNSKPQREALQAEEKAWVIGVMTVEPATATPQLGLYGRVRSPRTANMSAAVTADVRSVDVLEGQYVSSGETMVVLDDREAELLRAQRAAEVADISAQIDNERQRNQNDIKALEHEEMLLALNQREVKRAEKLAKRKVGSEAQIDQMRQAEERQAMAVDQRRFSINEHASRRAQLDARLARAKSLLRRAELDLDRTRVKAPFAGRVSRVSVSPGDRVRGGDEILTVYNTAEIEIRAQIPTRQVPLVRDALAQGNALEANALVDGRRLRARLDRFTAQVERGGGGADAYFRVIEGGKDLPLGRTVELIVDLPEVHGSIALPYEAVYGTNRIYRLDGDRMRTLDVDRVGERRSTDGSAQVLVRSPELQSGDRIVVTQLPNAMDGLRVRVAEP
ncbi:MAG: HlyD family efflux transporter periplasmic adaptor subunit [Gammaproteobacteria bacterium]|nr:HlyD family efflux transporter periplasmic adaptor subunit [Gammaproteobacteria bacterium]